MLEYLALLADKAPESVERLALDGPFGFHWLPFSKLELQFYSIRHVQHHAGQLTVWLREEAGQEMEWVGTA